MNIFPKSCTLSEIEIWFPIIGHWTCVPRMTMDPSSRKMQFLPIGFLPRVRFVLIRKCWQFHMNSFLPEFYSNQIWPWMKIASNYYFHFAFPLYFWYNDQLYLEYTAILTDRDGVVENCMDYSNTDQLFIVNQKTEFQRAWEESFWISHIISLVCCFTQNIVCADICLSNMSPGKCLNCSCYNKACSINWNVSTTRSNY